MCGPASSAAPADFSVTPCNGREFLTRIGALDPTVGPLPRFSPSSLRAHSIPLQPPLPWPEYQQHLHGDPVPDRGQTLDWPHP